MKISIPKYYFGLSFLFLILCFLFACSDKQPQKTEIQSKKQSEERILKRIEVNESATGFLFNYVDWKGQYHSVEKVADIPESFRNDVIVIDLKMSPAERNAVSSLVVADLELTDEKGNYRIRMEDRAQFEKAIALKRKWRLSETKNQLPKLTQDQLDKMNLPANEDKVILYSTSWCGYCKAAEKFFKQRGIQYIKKDIEKDDQAAMEMQAKCMKNGAQQCGVPVIDWKGQVVLGLDENRLKVLWEKEKAQN